MWVVVVVKVSVVGVSVVDATLCKGVAGCSNIVAEVCKSLLLDDVDKWLILFVTLDAVVVGAERGEFESMVVFV